jgi:ATP-dependent Clp protease adaptor protein ClpS
MAEDFESTVVNVVEEKQRRKKKAKRNARPRRQPRYNVILWDDDDHTYDYVIRMVQELFGHELEKAFLMAKEVDSSGRVICLTTTMEHAELKRDQIHAYGKDDLLERCKGSMSASIEPVD